MALRESLRPSLLFWYGQLLMLFKRHSRALENPYAGYQLAGVWHRLGRRDKLRAEYERIKGFEPKVAERIRMEFGLQPK